MQFVRSRPLLHLVKKHPCVFLDVCHFLLCYSIYCGILITFTYKMAFKIWHIEQVRVLVVMSGCNFAVTGVLVRQTATTCKR